MKFQDLLLRAKAGEQDAIHTILEMYKPLLLKESIVLGVRSFQKRRQALLF